MLPPAVWDFRNCSAVSIVTSIVSVRLDYKGGSGRHPLWYMNRLHKGALFYGNQLLLFKEILLTRTVTEKKLLLILLIPLDNLFLRLWANLNETLFVTIFFTKTRQVRNQFQGTVKQGGGCGKDPSEGAHIFTYDNPGYGKLSAHAGNLGKAKAL